MLFTIPMMIAANVPELQTRDNVLRVLHPHGCIRTDHVHYSRTRAPSPRILSLPQLTLQFAKYHYGCWEQ
jgi:hypothetical protein